ncbi:haloacid dehalogenase [Trinickia dabaoshanensis]|uniref:Haloacid dehalogenase n=1 Tax=Trinickia dabaoshanensis TaxID=564714 RepID=A0A2N7VUQ8_9BURK|nr:HAD family phosphatase [Trinickia dabaoshanensis]PMS20873.1 haloacid dehalogenase [Trinickia dabaoshanensis]
MKPRVVVFDFGGVLIDWNPDYLYRKLIPDVDERRRFLTEVCTMDWVMRQDEGQSIASGTEMLIERFPHEAERIRAFYDRWQEMIVGVFADSVALVDKLEAAGVPLFGLTNWSDETFPYAWERYDVLRRFRDVVVSGRVKLVKPDPRIYAEAFSRIDRHVPGVAPNEIVFIDDNLKNAHAAAAAGWHGIHHTSAAATEARLRELGFAFG